MAKQNYTLCTGAGHTLQSAKEAAQRHIVAWYKDPEGYHVDDKYVDMNNKYIKKMQKRKEDLGTVISTEINLNELKTGCSPCMKEAKKMELQISNRKISEIKINFITKKINLFS